MGGKRPDTTSETAGRPCARGDYCREATVTFGENDERIAAPAVVPRAFCETDRADVATALTTFPALYAELAADLYELRAESGQPGGAFESRMPLYADLAAAAARMHLILTSWETRIRAVPRADTEPGQGPEGEPPGQQVIRVAAGILHRNLDALLALPAAWMIRYAPAGRLRDEQLIAMPAAHPDDYWDRRRQAIVDVDVRIWDELDGARAGLEILHLHYSCQRLLGYIERKPEQLLGVACYRCRHRTLRRAAPPATDDDVLWYSQCKVCGHLMTEAGYRQHVARLAALIGGPRREQLQLCAAFAAGARHLLPCRRTFTMP